MLTARLRWLPLAFFLLCVITQGQEAKLEPGIEREIAGGESHTYQINLTVGQFVRFRLKQQAIDSALILTAPDGKLLVEMNLTGAGEEESLSMEAATAGTYRLTFDTGGYFDAANTAAFYPQAIVTFRVADPAQHYHVPLLLSPFGYSTYRGS